MPPPPPPSPLPRRAEIIARINYPANYDAHLCAAGRTIYDENWTSALSPRLSRRGARFLRART
jgi:hypothetical protein